MSEYLQFFGIPFDDNLEAVLRKIENSHQGSIELFLRAFDLLLRLVELFFAPANTGLMSLAVCPKRT
jgi:hypothetical protein